MIAKAAEAGHLEAVASETPEDIKKHLSDAMKKNRVEMRKLQELVVVAAGGYDDGGASSEDESRPEGTIKSPRGRITGKEKHRKRRELGPEAQKGEKSCRRHQDGEFSVRV